MKIEKITRVLVELARYAIWKRMKCAKIEQMKKLILNFIQTGSDESIVEQKIKSKLKMKSSITINMSCKLIELLTELTKFFNKR